jgi:hypothetical protein
MISSVNQSSSLTTTNAAVELIQVGIREIVANFAWHIVTVAKDIAVAVRTTATSLISITVAS